MDANGGRHLRRPARLLHLLFEASNSPIRRKRNPYFAFASCCDLKPSLPEVAPRIRPPDRFRRDRHRGVTERISVMGLGRAGEGSTRFIPLACRGFPATAALPPAALRLCSVVNDDKRSSFKRGDMMK